MRISLAGLPLVIVSIPLVLFACSNGGTSGDSRPDGAAEPQCKDGIDNDGDGKTDFPNDPGCLNENQNSETDDCPGGPGCPECGNGKDDDGDGKIDYGDDPDCTSAADPTEKGVNLDACGADVPINPLPTSGIASGTINIGPSHMVSQCGGLGPEVAYQIDVTDAISLTATTDVSATGVDTVLYLRGAMCTDTASELTCNDNAGAATTASTLSANLATGTYYLIVDAGSSTATGSYELHVTTYPGAGQPCDDTHACAPGSFCRTAPGGSGTTCQPPHCSDTVDNDTDGKTDYPEDPGCDGPTDDDETDDCPDGPDCPACSNHKDDDGDDKIDYGTSATNDPDCRSASQPVEGCATERDPMTLMTTGTATGDTNGLHDDWTLSCGGGPAPDVVYFVDLPRLDALTLSTAGSTFDTVLGLENQTCGTELDCNDEDDTSSGSSEIDRVDVAAGFYAVVVDGYDTSFSNSSGAFTLSVSGTISAGGRCDGALFAANALTCASGTACDGSICKGQLECNDGVDNDGDHKIDYPNDPGCDSATDTTESDDCPDGPSCPACGNNKDDDGDGEKDYPADTTCVAASGLSETCASVEAPIALTTATIDGDTTGLGSDFEPACASETGAPDLVYQLDLPALDSFSVDVQSDWSPVVELLDASCAGTALSCAEPPWSQTTIAAGHHFLVVDGDSADQFGTYTLTVSGTIANGGSCDGPLATSGALTCASGYACKGTSPSRTCQVAACNDGLDNDVPADGKKDFPNDPGCTSPSDDSEADACPNGAGCPACSNGKDDDGDNLKDYPADFGCTSAAGTSEAFCTQDRDKAGLIGTPTTSSTTTGAHDDFMPDCVSTSTAPDKVYALSLPVAVDTLTIDTNNSAFDTVLSVTDSTCGLPSLACDDGGGTGGPSPSLITMTGVAPGAYGIIVDGYDTEHGGYLLHVNGIVAPGTTCTSSLFVTGVLTCPAGQVCKAGKCAP